MKKPCANDRKHENDDNTRHYAGCFHLFQSGCTGDPPTYHSVAYCCIFMG